MAIWRYGDIGEMVIMAHGYTWLHMVMRGHAWSCLVMLTYKQSKWRQGSKWLQAVKRLYTVSKTMRIM